MLQIDIGPWTLGQLHSAAEGLKKRHRALAIAVWELVAPPDGGEHKPPVRKVSGAEADQVLAKFFKKE